MTFDWRPDLRPGARLPNRDLRCEYPVRLDELGGYHPGDRLRHDPDLLRALVAHARQFYPERTTP